MCAHALRSLVQTVGATSLSRLPLTPIPTQAPRAAQRGTPLGNITCAQAASRAIWSQRALRLLRPNFRRGAHRRVVLRRSLCGVADKSARDSRISWAKLSGAASGMGQIFVWGTNTCGELGGGFDPRVLPLLSHSSLPQPQPQPGGTDPMHHGYARSQRVCNEPVPVDRLPGDATFVNIACGATHSVAISSAPQLIYHACNRHATERTGIAAL